MNEGRKKKRKLESKTRIGKDRIRSEKKSKIKVAP